MNKEDHLICNNIASYNKAKIEYTNVMIMGLGVNKYSVDN